MILSVVYAKQNAVCEKALPIEIEFVDEVIAGKQSGQRVNLILMGSVHWPIYD